jgi:thiamine biosynthesis protein ThiI
MPEYCGVISDKPATGAKLEQILEEEKKFPFELLEKAIENKKIEWIDKVLEKENISLSLTLPPSQGGREYKMEVEVAYIP